MGRKITNLETAIRNVFADLEDNGFSTGTPDTIEYNCCQTCSWSSFEDKDKEKSIVFYHIQDREHYREDIKDQVLEPSLYLAHSFISEEDKSLFLSCLLQHRVNIDWDLTRETRPRVFMAPKDKTRGEIVERSDIDFVANWWVA